jgi:GTP-binding protein
LRSEIASYSQALAEKPHCVVFTKMDLLGESEPPPIEAPGANGVFAVSAAGRIGVDELMAAWWSALLAMRKANERASERTPLP